MHTMRNDRLDFYKGFLMWGVMWGHTITALRAGEGKSVWILTYFRTYDMPFFMLLSGYFLSVSLAKKSWKSVACNRVGTILLPLVAWQILIDLIYRQVNNLFSLWFLWSAFACSMITIFVSGIIANKKNAAIILSVFSIGLHFIPKNIFNLGYMLPFFVIGFYLQIIYKKFARFKNEYVLFISFFLFVIMQCFWQGKYNVWNAGTYVLINPQYMLPVIFFRGAIGINGCFVMKNVFDNFYSLAGEKVKNFFSFIGENTLLLYILQSVLIENVLNKSVIKLRDIVGFNVFTLNMQLLGYVSAPLISLVAIVVLLLLIRIIKNIPVVSKILMGFKLC